MHTKAIVMSLDGKDALVESIQGGGCGHCESKDGCGSSKLSQLFCSEPRRFRVRNDSNAQVGNFVQVVVPEGVLLQSALLMYILPLILLLLGAVLGAHLSNDATSSDAYSAVGGFAGLVLGFVVAKGLAIRQRLVSSAQPIIMPTTDIHSVAE